MRWLQGWLSCRRPRPVSMPWVNGLSSWVNWIRKNLISTSHHRWADRKCSSRTANRASRDLNQSISRLSKVLSSQFARLDALQLLLLDRNLEQERTPAGWPVSSGWISSGFGERNDPFTGKKTTHEGLDFAGIKGSEVLAVASGAVIWSGSRPGFGKLLEIDHGNGYITRYAHNDQLLVNAGDSISAGQEIAKMGSTGRASSPHVHFEVLYKGKAVNPYKFVKQGR